MPVAQPSASADPDAFVVIRKLAAPVLCDTAVSRVNVAPSCGAQPQGAPAQSVSKLGFSAALERNATSSKFTAVPGAQPLQLW